MTPGRILHRLAISICSKKSVEAIIEPAIADFQHEWTAARARGERLRVLLRGYTAVWLALGWTAGRAFLGNVLSLTWRDAFPMPGMYVAVILLIGISESWVRTGTIFSMWGQRLASIETRYLWCLIPSLLVGPYWAGLSWKARAVWLPICGLPVVFVTQIGSVAMLRGWQPLVAWVLLTTLLNAAQRPRASVADNH